MKKGQICDRCGQKKNSFTMSIFNTDWICEDCCEKETAHPQYHKARKIEAEHCRKGNYNYEGIGLPDDLREG
jgi:hypothetical protein